MAGQRDEEEGKEMRRRGNGMRKNILLALGFGRRRDKQRAWVRLADVYGPHATFPPERVSHEDRENEREPRKTQPEVAVERPARFPRKISLFHRLLSHSPVSHNASKRVYLNGSVACAVLQNVVFVNTVCSYLRGSYVKTTSTRQCGFLSRL